MIKAKSSFTLPISEISLVEELKAKLKFRSNTQVIRLALKELHDKLNRQMLRNQFAQASQLVRTENKQDYEELSELDGEGLE